MKSESTGFEFAQINEEEKVRTEVKIDMDQSSVRGLKIGHGSSLQGGVSGGTSFVL